MASAYVVAFVDTTQTPPVVVAAGIFSEGRSITTDIRRRFPLELLDVQAADYEAAHKLAREYVEKDPSLSWLKPLMWREEFG